MPVSMTSRHPAVGESILPSDRTITIVLEDLTVGEYLYAGIPPATVPSPYLRLTDSGGLFYSDTQVALITSLDDGSQPFDVQGSSEFVVSAVGVGWPGATTPPTLSRWKKLTITVTKLADWELGDYTAKVKCVATDDIVAPQIVWDFHVIAGSGGGGGGGLGSTGGILRGGRRRMANRTDADIANMALLYAGVNQKIGDLNEASAAAQACNTIYAEMRRKVLSEFRWTFAIKRQQLVPYSGNAYDATTAYGKDQLSQFGSNVYRSLQAANTGHQPDLSASAAWWTQVTRDGYAFACPLPDDAINLIAVWEKPSAGAKSLPPIFQFVQDTSGLSLRNPRSSGRVPFSLENSADGTDDQVLLTDVDTPILKYVAEVTNPGAFPSPFVDALAWALAGPLCRGIRGDEDKANNCDKKYISAVASAFISVMRDQQDDEEPISEFEAAREGAP